MQGNNVFVLIAASSSGVMGPLSRMIGIRTAWLGALTTERFGSWRMFEPSPYSGSSGKSGSEVFCFRFTRWNLMETLTILAGVLPLF